MAEQIYKDGIVWLDGKCVCSDLKYKCFFHFNPKTNLLYQLTLAADKVLAEWRFYCWNLVFDTYPSR